MKRQRASEQWKLPTDGCGRCVWWNRRPHTGHGKCMLFREQRWYCCMPCCEYERDSQASDTIDVYKSDVA